MSTPDTFGSLLRLQGIKRSQLPPPTATPAELTAFLTALLREAIPFLDSVSSSPTPAPSASSLWKPKSTKSFAASAAKVRLLERRIPARLLALPDSPVPPAPSEAAAAAAPPLRDEAWACRVSAHEDRAAPGSASWPEFRAALRDAHAETEMAFTPSVKAARRAAGWDCGRVAPLAVAGGTWRALTLAVLEMRHAVGRPVLKDRVFPVLQMAASALERAEGDGEGEGAWREKDEFVVVSVTVADFAEAPEARIAKEPDVVVAAYASVERVRRLPAGGGGGEIEWIMATASDARGSLPMWVQTKAVPGQIAKDVALFLAWAAEERSKGKVTGGGREEAAANGGQATSRREDTANDNEQKAAG